MCFVIGIVAFLTVLVWLVPITSQHLQVDQLLANANIPDLIRQEIANLYGQAHLQIMGLIGASIFITALGTLFLAKRMYRDSLVSITHHVQSLILEPEAKPLLLDPDPFVGRLAQAIHKLGTVYNEAKAIGTREQKARRKLETALSISEQRYELTIRCAADGYWERDLKSEQIFYSPIWKQQLGYEDWEISSSINEWLDRIHPEDLAETSEKFEASASGAVDAFEVYQRLQHRDGHYRWFIVRGRVVRSAIGEAHRIIGMTTDVTVLKRNEEVLLRIADGLAQAKREEFFQILVKNFAEALGMNVVFVAECVDDPTTRVRTLAYWRDGIFKDPFEFDLAGTSCEVTIQTGAEYIVPAGLETLFPDREAGRQSYLGMPIRNNKGRIIGHIACFNYQPTDEDILRMPVLRVFAALSGIVLESIIHSRLAA